jgi:hypothetical protein|tara:strand:+ start:866 stop:1060 length:195 start_codon:yes stop_codon:yes gene_type:complete
MVGLLTEAHSVGGRMTQNFTFTVLEGLSSFLVLMERGRETLVISSVLSRAFSFLAFLREQPSES